MAFNLPEIRFYQTPLQRLVEVFGKEREKVEAHRGQSRFLQSLEVWKFDHCEKHLMQTYLHFGDFPLTIPF